MDHYPASEYHTTKASYSNGSVIQKLNFQMSIATLCEFIFNSKRYLLIRNIAEFRIIIHVRRLAKQKVRIRIIMRRYPNAKTCINICKISITIYMKVCKIRNIMLILYKILHTYAEFCILIQNSAYKSANLCQIPHYNSHAEVSMCIRSHYKGMQR